MATANDIYSLATYDYLEDGDLSLGIVTDLQWINLLNLAIDEWFRSTGLIQRIYTQQLIGSQGLYAVPDDIIRVDAVFLGGVWVPKATQTQLNKSMRGWRSQSSPPKFWYEDGLPIKTIGLAPSPASSSSDMANPVYDTFDPGDALTIVGPCRSLTQVFTTIDPIPLIPDDFVLAYLLSGVHRRLFAADSELQDIQVGMFEEAQWKEGISLAKAISGEPDSEER